MGVVGTIPQIGAEYAGYRIDGLLGRGGMSVVFRAENPRLGNLVALKLLAPELAHDDMFRERFVRESRVAASINHPNIVPIYDFGDHDGLLYIVMRYVQGADLKHMIQRRGRLTPQQTVAVITQAGRALDAAHARGLIHRDVKPANFLIEPSSADDGGADHVYLADFGLTKHSQSKSGLTATGVFVGTIDYVAPEQISGGDVDARTDIYSMGCVLYECLTGHIPFEKDAEMAVLYAHVHEDPPGPSELQPELPAAIDVVMRKALAKSPDDRYQSCRELVSAVADALGERPSAAQATPMLADEDSKTAAPMPPPPLRPASEPAAPAAGATVIAGTAAAAPAAGETVFAGTAAAAPAPSLTDGSEQASEAGTSGSVAKTPGRGWPPDAAAPPPDRGGGSHGAGPPPGGGGPRKRWPLVATGAVMVVVAAGVGVLLFGGGSSSPSPPSSGSTTTASTPTQLDDAIANARASTGPMGVNHHLGACSKASSTPGGAIQAVTCTSNEFLGVHDPVTITQFKTMSGMYQQYERLLGSDRGASTKHNINSCRGSEAVAKGGETAWRHAAPLQTYYDWNKQEGASAPGAKVAGRVFCGPNPQATMFYAASTNDADRTLLVVQGPSHDNVFSLWRGIHHNLELAPMNMSQ